MIRNLFLLAFSFGVIGANAQELTQLKAQRDSIKKIQTTQKKALNQTTKRLDSLKQAIKVLSGWNVEGGGLIGLNFSKTEDWVSNPNPNSLTSNLSIGLTLDARIDKKKSFWNNSSSVNLNWQSLDRDTDEGDQSRFLENRTTDVLSISSLYGYKVNRSLAISSLFDLNSSVFSFLRPGSIDLSTGLTWKPNKIKNLTVVIHLLSYHLAFAQPDAATNTENANGAKFKISYARKFPLGINWTSNLNSFVPYRMAAENVPSLFEFTWINTFNVKIWKAVGVGLNVGIRRANFEVENTQFFNALGISYGF